MNKVIPSDDRVFMSVVGPSGCGKTRFVFDLIEKNIFKPPFEKIFYFYQHYQKLFGEMVKNFPHIEFIQGVNFDMINNDIPNDGTSYLLIFDDSCEEISKSKEFQALATAGRHKKLSVIYIKHNLYHKSPLGRDIELQNTHIVLFKSPRDVQQIKVLSKQLGLGTTLNLWYKKATEKPYAHLMIDLQPKTVDQLRFSSGFNPTVFFLLPTQSRITVLDDVHTALSYS